MTLRYRINNPLGYTLDFVNASNVVKTALDNALFHASSQFTVDEALLGGFALQEKILARVRQVVEANRLGITIEDSDIRTRPPRYVNKDFLEVQNAEQARRTALSEARADANRMLSSAESEAKSVISQGETEAKRLVQTVAAEAQYFADQLPYYQSNPQLFIARLQTETFQRILTNAQDKFIRMDNGERKWWIQASREPMKPAGQIQVEQQQEQQRQQQMRRPGP
jgi:regulator of protease activity HflC (stomatin/prohibitin superfamily)